MGDNGAASALEIDSGKRDAEVCGTAVETAMTISVRLTLRRDLSLTFPQYRIPAGELGRTEMSSYHESQGA